MPPGYLGRIVAYQLGLVFSLLGLVLVLIHIACCIGPPRTIIASTMNVLYPQMTMLLTVKPALHLQVT